MLKFFLLLIAIFQIAYASSPDDEKSSNETSTSIESNETDFSRRIIGGDTAKQGQYSFVVWLISNFGNKGEGFCSGTILSNRVILTAAHCIYSQGRKADYVWVQVMGTKYSVYLISQGEIHMHPSFSEKFADDVAIIKLASNRQPMRTFGSLPRLPDGNMAYDIYTKTEAVVAGWGKTSDYSDVSQTLQYAHVNTITNDQCKQYYGIIIQPGVLCTLNKKKGVCGGDSGGPLMITRDSQLYVIGVNAFGYKLCQYYAPSGYTNVLHYIKWIKDVIN